MDQNRKLVRMKGYDYSQPGSYYVTVNTHKNVCHFGKVAGNKTILNGFGRIVESQWRWLAERYNHVKLDEYIVMPNHLHGILTIKSGIAVGNGRDRSLQRKIKPLPELIGAFKTTSSKLIHSAGLAGFQWQKSYYDRIVRNDMDLERIREYIRNNPARWTKRI